MGNLLIFPAPSPTYTVSSEILQKYLIWIEDSEQQEAFPCLWLHCETPHSVLYFHGNSVDLGDLVDELAVMHKCLQCNILAIEFPGYGVTSGVSTSSDKIDSWGIAAFNWLTNHGIPPLSILTMGRSIGTGPAAKLAATLKRRGISIGGVILHCPFLSIHKIIAEYANIATWFIGNFWDTEESLKHIAPTTPLLIIHGKNDEIIPVSHGQNLYNNYRAYAEVKACSFPEDSPHNAYSVIDDVIVPVKRFLERTSLSRIYPPKKFEAYAEESFKKQGHRYQYNKDLSLTRKAEFLINNVGGSKILSDKPSQKLISAIRSLSDL